jgi:hypothetical protein
MAIANNDPLSDALGLNPISKPSKEIANIIAVAHNDSAKKDFEEARANIHSVIQTALGAIEVLSTIAEQSQQARDFEVLAKIMDTTLNANKDLLALQTTIRSIERSDRPINDEAKTINNNMFVGSTTELAKIIEEMKNNAKTNE